MDDLKNGRPVERTWVLYHALIGLGAGLLFVPSAPPFCFVIVFLVASMCAILGVQFRKQSFVMLGLVGLAGAQLARAAFLWRHADVGAGSRLVASFLWVMLAVGAIMEAYSVKNRGIA
jgi:hypothetical protein